MNINPNGGSKLSAVIYKIQNLVNGIIYIGSTVNFEKRKQRHLSALLNNQHHSVYLQRAFNKYGSENFIFTIVEHFSSEIEARDAEQLILDEQYDQLYNISKQSSGGDLISYHPNKDDIIQRINTSLNNTINNMTTAERAKKYGRAKESNGMFNKTHSDESKNKISNAVNAHYSSHGHPMTGRTYEEMYGTEKAADMRQAISERQASRCGKLNSFYGKRHSDKTKQQISESATGRPSSVKKAISIDGVIFESCTDAAKSLGVSVPLITYRLKSALGKYEGYKYC